MYLLIDWLHMFVHVYMLGGHMYVMTHMWESEDNFWKSILSSTMWAPGVGLKLLDVPAIDFPTGESSWLLLYNLPLSCDFGFYSRLILKMLTFHHANVNLTTVGLKALDLLLDSGESSHKCSLLSMVRVKVWTSQLWFLERFFSMSAFSVPLVSGCFSDAIQDLGSECCWCGPPIFPFLVLAWLPKSAPIIHILGTFFCIYPQSLFLIKHVALLLQCLLDVTCFQNPFHPR